MFKNGPHQWSQCSKRMALPDFAVTTRSHFNQATHTDSYPLPHIKDMLASLSGGTTFSKLNLAHAYRQVTLNDELKGMATINTHKGLYRFNCLPFSVAWVPSMFQCIMETTLQGLPSIFVYINDILVTRKTIEEHLPNLMLAFKSMVFGWCMKSVHFSCLTSTYRKSQAIQNVSQLKSFLQLVNYRIAGNIRGI